MAIFVSNLEVSKPSRGSLEYISLVELIDFKHIKNIPTKFLKATKLQQTLSNYDSSSYETKLRHETSK